MYISYAGFSGLRRYQYILETCGLLLFGGDGLAVNSLLTLFNMDRTRESLS